MHSKWRCKIVSQCSAILGELESFRNYEEFRIVFLPETFRCNLTYYEGDNFSDSFFHHIFEPENFRIFFTRYEKKEDSPRCPFCPADHTIIHLFTECQLYVCMFNKVVLEKKKKIA